MDFLETRYQKSPFVVFRKIVDEYVLVPIRKNVGDLESIYTLNEVGAEIWEQIDGKATLKQIQDSLTDKFDISQKEAGRDLIEFVKGLTDRNCITENKG